jgi:hypothetical protein
MKKFIRTITIFLVMTLLLSYNILYVFATEDKIMLSIDEIKAAIAPLVEAEEEYYVVHDISVDSVATELQEDGTLRTTCSIRLSMSLRATTIDELPYIAGMLEVVGVSSLEKCTPSELIACGFINRLQEDTAITANSSIYKTNTDYSIAKYIADATVEMASPYASYIGEISDFSFDIVIDSDSNHEIINIFGLSDVTTNGVQEVFPLCNYFPPEKAVLKEQGRRDLLSKIDSMQNESAMGSNSLEPSFNRNAARNYAFVYSSEASTSQTCPHGHTRINLSKYNSAYTYYCHNDCANFVSQCIYAGGIPTDTNWSPGCTAWTYVPSLYHYFYELKGYWITSSYSTCTAGGIIINQNSSGAMYHVNLCVYNDSVTHKYAAHNADHNNKVFTSTYWGSETVLYYEFGF